MEGWDAERGRSRSNFLDPSAGGRPLASETASQEQPEQDEELSELEDHPIPKRVQISAAWNHQLVTTGSGTLVVPVVMDDLEGTARNIDVHPQEKICLIQPFTRCFQSLREKKHEFRPCHLLCEWFLCEGPYSLPQSYLVRIGVV